MGLQDFARPQPCFLTQNLHQPFGLIVDQRGLRALGADVIRILVRNNLIRCGLVDDSRINGRFARSRSFLGNVAPPDYIRRWAYPSPNIIMVIAGDRQHMVAIKDLDYLKYMMCFDANGTSAWTVKRTTGI
jgi:hypothetical protein